MPGKPSWKSPSFRLRTEGGVVGGGKEQVVVEEEKQVTGRKRRENKRSKGGRPIGEREPVEQADESTVGRKARRQRGVLVAPPGGRKHSEPESLQTDVVMARCRSYLRGLAVCVTVLLLASGVVMIGVGFSSIDGNTPVAVLFDQLSSSDGLLVLQVFGPITVLLSRPGNWSSEFRPCVTVGSDLYPPTPQVTDTWVHSEPCGPILKSYLSFPIKLRIGIISAFATIALRIHDDDSMMHHINNNDTATQRHGDGHENNNTINCDPRLCASLCGDTSAPYEDYYFLQKHFSSLARWFPAPPESHGMIQLGNKEIIKAV
ncbi:hypothetical protein F2P81_017883 [Scophthalmus maximus]|uniref:Uncharacterized protein n=1 Tax=Scophthalmus maximus TaxID=52904 RepID=A0A6A4S962_SCOMX|nr:hypothetical protein F2P81_017883 [Scophthalmus maximus]